MNYASLYVHAWPLTIYKRTARDRNQRSGIYALCTFTVHFRGRSRFHVTDFSWPASFPLADFIFVVRESVSGIAEELSDAADKTKKKRNVPVMD
jgi:hypothetical protein